MMLSAAGKGETREAAQLLEGFRWLGRLFDADLSGKPTVRGANAFLVPVRDLDVERAEAKLGEAEGLPDPVAARTSMGHRPEAKRQFHTTTHLNSLNGQRRCG